MMQHHESYILSQSYTGPKPTASNKNETLYLLSRLTFTLKHTMLWATIAATQLLLLLLLLIKATVLLLLLVRPVAECGKTDPKISALHSPTPSRARQRGMNLPGIFSRDRSEVLAAEG